MHCDRKHIKRAESVPSILVTEEMSGTGSLLVKRQVGPCIVNHWHECWPRHMLPDVCWLVTRKESRTNLGRVTFMIIQHVNTPHGSLRKARTRGNVGTTDGYMSYRIQCLILIQWLSRCLSLMGEG